MRNVLMLLVVAAACGQTQKQTAGHQRAQSLEELLNDAINREPGRGAAAAAGRVQQAGGQYYRMQMARIVDSEGFGQPVEVGRFLIPSDWRQEGGVFWDQSKIHCPSNIIQTRYRAGSADGASGFEIHPVYVWQAASDPMMQQIMQQQAAMKQGCDVGPVTDALNYLQRVVVPKLRSGQAGGACRGLWTAGARRVCSRLSADGGRGACGVPGGRAGCGGVDIDHGDGVGDAVGQHVGAYAGDV
jgi:hypothetical protein